jgi:hypothetical protein
LTVKKILDLPKLLADKKRGAMDIFLVSHPFGLFGQLNAQAPCFYPYHVGVGLGIYLAQIELT